MLSGCTFVPPISPQASSHDIIQALAGGTRKIPRHLTAAADSITLHPSVCSVGLFCAGHTVELTSFNFAEHTWHWSMSEKHLSVHGELGWQEGPFVEWL